MSNERMRRPDASAHAGVPRRRWVRAIPACVLVTLLAAAAWLYLHHRPRVWGEVRAFVMAFGGFIGVAVLLGLGLVILLVAERVFFRDKGPGSGR